MTTIAGKIFTHHSLSPGAGRRGRMCCCSAARPMPSARSIASRAHRRSARLTPLRDVADRVAVASIIARRTRVRRARRLIHGAAIGSAREFSEMEFEIRPRDARQSLRQPHLSKPSCLRCCARARQDRAVGSMGGYLRSTATPLRHFEVRRVGSPMPALPAQPRGSTSPVSAPVKSTLQVSLTNASSSSASRALKNIADHRATPRRTH